MPNGNELQTSDKLSGQVCELCGRPQPLTEHHLIPRAVHGKKRFIERFGKDEMRSRKLKVCRLCHSGIHDIIPDEKTLAESFNTKELLVAHDGIQRHVKWARKQK